MTKKYRYKLKFEDIMIWIIIAGLIGISLWMLSGSPTEIGAIIGIGTFIGASEILIWKKIFFLDNKIDLNLLKINKKTEISFINLRNDMNNRFNIIENKLNNLGTN